jgi:hypothetical protein
MGETGAVEAEFGGSYGERAEYCVYWALGEGRAVDVDDVLPGVVFEGSWCESVTSG